MANVFALRNLTFKRAIREPMRQFLKLAVIHSAVTSACNAANPQPATAIRFRHPRLAELFCVHASNRQLTCLHVQLFIYFYFRHSAAIGTLLACLHVAWQRLSRPAWQSQFCALYSTLERAPCRLCEQILSTSCHILLASRHLSSLDASQPTFTIHSVASSLRDK